LNSVRIPLLLALAFAALPPARAQDPSPVDWPRARELHRRDQRGEALSPEERAVLERVRAQRIARPAG